MQQLCSIDFQLHMSHLQDVINLLFLPQNLSYLKGVFIGAVNSVCNDAAASFWLDDVFDPNGEMPWVSGQDGNYTTSMDACYPLSQAIAEVMAINLLVIDWDNEIQSSQFSFAA